MSFVLALWCFSPAGSVSRTSIVAPVLAQSPANQAPRTATIEAVGDVTLAGPAAIRAYMERLPRVTPDAARGLRNAGFAAVSLANNHTMDFAAPALRVTLVSLASNGIAAAGAASDLRQTLQPGRFDRAGVRFARAVASGILASEFAAGSPSVTRVAVR